MYDWSNYWARGIQHRSAVRYSSLKPFHKGVKKSALKKVLKEIAARRDGRKELTLVDTWLIEFHTGVYKVPTNLISLTPPLSIFQLDFLPQTFLQRGVSGVSPGFFFKKWAI